MDDRTRQGSHLVPRGAFRGEAGWALRPEYLAVVDDRQLDVWKEVLHDGIEQRHIDRGELGDVHVPHGQQQNLEREKT